MLNKWFGKEEAHRPNGPLCALGKSPSDSVLNGSTERNEQVKKLLEGHQPATPPVPLPFEQIYQTASVKPPKLTYGIQKVAEMGNSAHLTGMSTPLRRKALLMALEAAGTDVGHVLNNVVTRQRALKEYEESYQEKVNQFEAEQLEQNRLQKAELDRITAQFKARMDASLADIERWQKEFREWQKLKQQELQRLTDAAALCVPRESEEDSEQDKDEIAENKVMAFTQRAGGASR